MLTRDNRISTTNLFPSLAGQGAVAIDCETRDEELKTRGPGYHRPNCYVAGVAVATEAGFARYYPIAHEQGENLDKAKVLSWLRRELSRTSQPKVFANSLYDLGFLAKAGIPVAGKIWDVQVAEPLLDENKLSYSLERILQTYGHAGKYDEEMDAWLVSKFGKKNPKGSIWRAPPEVVAPYALGDAVPLLDVFAKQRRELERQNLWDLFEMESKLLPMLLAMRMRGVRVDLARAEEARDRFRKQKERVEREVRRVVGAGVEIWAAASIGAAFDRLGLAYPRTPKTKAPSFTKGFLKDHPHRVSQLIVEARRLDKLIGVFLEGAILESHVDGRVYTQFHSMKSDDGGTVTGRFSSSMPNLQQIPRRGDDAKLVRSMFVPDAGKLWWKTDFSQVEFRLLVHDAVSTRLRGASEICDSFNTDPKTDFHEEVARIAGIDRDSAKTVNFGIAYGEGRDKLSRQLGLSTEGAEELLSNYHKRIPFMRPLSDMFMSMAGKSGEIRTLLNRKRRFDAWEMTKWNKDGTRESVVIREPRKGFRRAFTYRALNARIQGSAADVMKVSMVDIWESGACDIIGVPQLTVHDELDGSYPDTKVGREALREVKAIQERCVKLTLPLKVDLSVGTNWGNLKDLPSNKK